MVGTEVIYLDTHVLIYLSAGAVNRLSAAACTAIDRHDLRASPAVVLELEFLHEIGRLKPTASKLMALLAGDIGLRICELPFRTILDHALTQTWTRDPFDRLIVANAKAAGAPLVTRDERIRENYARALW
jgi:PIN domain nuclease of toxin-antitoxin system